MHSCTVCVCVRACYVYVCGLRSLFLHQGHPGARAAVARSVLVGEGVKKDVKRGLAMLHKAADETSDPEALFVLSTSYCAGMPGVRVDKKKGEQ